MSSNLNDFIRENRSAFDSEEPPADGWKNLEQSITGKKKTKQFSLRELYKWSAIAAAAFIGLTSFYFLVLHNRFYPPAKTNDPVAKVSDLSNLSPGYSVEASKISQAIESRQKELKALAEEQPKLYQQFSADLAALDSSYRVLKAQAMQTTNREIILEAMLQNLRLQSELLAKQLAIIHEYSTNKNDKDEKNSYRRI